jgi:hypothetical protein
VRCDDACGWVEVSPCADITDVDVVLLFDMTGSHAFEIEALLPSLRTDVVDPLLALGAAVGVAAFADFNYSTYGAAGDAPFVGVSEPVLDSASVVAALAALPTMNGEDYSESGVEALSVLAGGPVSPYVLEPMVCSAGRVAGGCWRPGAVHVIVLFTDAMSHNGPDPASAALYEPYIGIAPAPAEWPDVAPLLVADDVGLFVRAVFSWIPEPTPQYEEMVTDLGQSTTQVGEWADLADLTAAIQGFVGW